MKHVVWMALMLALAAPFLPAVTLAQTDGPVAAAALTAAGDQGVIQPQGDRWYRYDVTGAVEQVDFTLHFWPNDAAQYQQVRLELYAQPTGAEMTPLGQGFAMSRQEEGLPVGRRVWMGWLVPGSYVIRVSNESGNAKNFMVNLGQGGSSPAPAAVTARNAEPGFAPDAPAARPSLLSSGVLGLRGLRPPTIGKAPANSIDAILDNSNNLYPADAPMAYEIQHGRVRYGQVRWYKIEIGDKQERIDVAMHFWPSNGNVYHHVFFGIFTDYRLQVWQHDGPFQAIGVGGDTGREEDRALVMNKKIWRGDLPHGVHYIGVWVDTDLSDKKWGDDNIDFIDYLIVPTFYNQPNLPAPVTNIPEWLAKPLAAAPVQGAVLASPRLTRPVPPAVAPSASVKPPDGPPGSGVLRDSDANSLAPMTDRWYRYDVKNKDGDNLKVTIQWNYSDGNTYHQAGFGVYDRFQFDAYLRDADSNNLGLGLAGSTGIDADYGPPMSRKIWRGMLPEGSYFIRVYNSSKGQMDYSLQVSR